MTRRVLLTGVVGLNTNRHTSSQASKDVARVKKMVMEVYKVTEDNIAVMLDLDNYQHPTVDAVESKFAEMADASEPGDSLMYFFSGHGGWLGSTRYMLMSDGLSITDQRLTEMAKSVNKECKVYVVADSCFSGNLILGLKSQVGDSPGVREEDAGVSHVVLLSSCRSNEETRAASVGNSGGAFTYLFVEVLTKKSGRVSPKFLIDVVNTHTQQIKLHPADKPSFFLGDKQHACLFCHDTQVDEYFFGGPP